MKRILPLILIVLLPGCWPKATTEAHRQAGEILVNYNQQVNELFEATVQDFEVAAQTNLNTNEAWMIEIATDENGNVPVEKLMEIRDKKIVTELINAERFDRLRLKWQENERNFGAAMELFEAVQSWLNLTGIPWIF